MTLPAGYTARPGTEADVDAMVAVANAYDVADLGRPDTAREHILEGVSGPDVDPDRDTLLVLDGRGRLVAFGMLEAEPAGVVEAFGRVHPEHRGRGLGAFLVETMEARATDISRGRSNHRLLHNAVTSTDAAARRLLDDRGYEPVRYFWHMERSLQRADARGALDDGPFSIAPAGCEDDLRRARAVLDEAFRGQWMVEPWAFDRWRRHLEDVSGTVLVASDGEEAVGAITWMPTSGGGWIEELGVREPWRGRGLGGTLLRCAFADLARGGVREIRLNVDAQNPTGATRLYERVGMRVHREWLVFEKPLPAVSGRLPGRGRRT